jgi:hypothetical protein
MTSYNLERRALVSMEKARRVRHCFHAEADDEIKANGLPRAMC